MIIEIGTSDFRTLAGQVDGLFIEPVKEHFNRLPECRKENVAVSNKAGIMEMHYIPTETIEGLGLPNWLRGCNSINRIHPTIREMGLEKYVCSQFVRVVRILTLIEKYNIKEVDVLKIDTEGHDCIILNDWLDTVDIMPKVIQFESNTLSNKKDVDAVVLRLKDKGYKCEQVRFDMVCKL
jgi:FkbM family methyltransferase